MPLPIVCREIIDKFLEELTESKNLYGIFTKEMRVENPELYKFLKELTFKNKAPSDIPVESQAVLQGFVACYGLLTAQAKRLDGTEGDNSISVVVAEAEEASKVVVLDADDDSYD